jgi:hypothetical protein
LVLKAFRFSLLWWDVDFAYQVICEIPGCCMSDNRKC